MNPLLSVVIPAYNASLTLKEAIDSALEQTHPAHEIIVVDDGSTDNTKAVCERYGERIRYVYQTNQGVSRARNTGIAAATGNWIALLDADDVMLRNRLQVQHELIAASPKNTVLVYSAFEYLFGPGMINSSGRTRWPVYPSKDLWPALRYKNVILPSTATILRSALLEVGSFHDSIVEDWHLWLRLAQRFSPQSFVSSPECLVIYRQAANTLSRNFRRMHSGHLEMLDTLLVTDLKGWRKKVWERRLKARWYHFLSVDLRDSNDAQYWEFAIESLLTWPFFGKIVTRHRYTIFANMVYKRGRINLRLLLPSRPRRGTDGHKRPTVLAENNNVTKQ
jgi:teichuronic acid biosynthesis glycosyltransferase TuaG